VTTSFFAKVHRFPRLALKSRKGGGVPGRCGKGPDLLLLEGGRDTTRGTDTGTKWAAYIQEEKRKQNGLSRGGKVTIKEENREGVSSLGRNEGDCGGRISTRE